MTTDEELAGLYASGDKDAFDELHSRYRGKIFGYACRMLGSRGLAEDVCQEVFFRVHSRIGLYQPRSRFAAWIFTIASNVCTDAQRKRKRERWLWFGLPVREPRATADIESEAVRDQLRQRILQEVQKLDEKYRQVFLLRVHGNLLFREIAEMLNTPLNTVLVRYHQAVLGLKAILKQAPCEGGAEAYRKDRETSR